MLATALKPRWLALLAAVVGVGYVFTLLGLWQLNVAKDSAREEALTAARNRPVVPIAQVAAPHTMLSEDASGRFVTAVGTYDATRQIVIVDRRLGGASGSWVLTPLILSDGGVVLPIVRGFVPDTAAGVATPAAIPSAPTGRIEVQGLLAPGEGPPDRPRSLPSGQMQKVDLSVLVNAWPEELYSAFVFAQSEKAMSGSASARPAADITRVPPPEPHTSGIMLRNAAYAVQWWLFAAFALFMWWRMVRDDYLGRSNAPPTESAHELAGPAGVPAQNLQEKRS